MLLGARDILRRGAKMYLVYQILTKKKLIFCLISGWGRSFQAKKWKKLLFFFCQFGHLRKGYHLSLKQLNRCKWKFWIFLARWLHFVLRITATCLNFEGKKSPLPIHTGLPIWAQMVVPLYFRFQISFCVMTKNVIHFWTRKKKFFPQKSH